MTGPSTMKHHVELHDRIRALEAELADAGATFHRNGALSDERDALNARVAELEARAAS